MFIGHYGVALAAKRLAPRTSLGTLVLAAEFVDALWPIFLMACIEHVRIAPGITRVSPLDFYDYPISHSLLTGIGWAAAFGLIYFALRRYARGAWVAAALWCTVPTCRSRRTDASSDSGCGIRSRPP